MSEPKPPTQEITPAVDCGSFAAQPVPASTILERTLNGKEIDAKYRARMQAMVVILDRFLETSELNPRIQRAIAKLPAEIRDGETGEGYDHIAARIRERIRRAVHFFVTSNEQWTSSPLMRLAELFDTVVVDSALDERKKEKLNIAIQRYIETLIPLAFEQQWQDPPQFVSHDWSHSMRVAEHAIGIAKALSPDNSFENSPVVRNMMQRYRISAQEVQLILYHATVCHDCGYPHLNGRSKSMHAIDSAELAACDSFVHSIETLIQSPNADMDVLKKDLYDAVFYHGADVAQDRFQIRIITDRGSFLTTLQKFKDVLSILQQSHTSPTATPRIIEKIEYAGAQSESAKKEIQNISQQLCPSAQKKLLDGIPFFTGRTFDLMQKGDKAAGIEYVYADSNEQPLLTLVRLADNMDLTSDRLGRVRHHPAYYDIIRRIGRGGKEHRLFTLLEQWHHENFADTQEIHTKIKAHFHLTELPEQEIATIINGTQARDWMIGYVLQEVLKKYPQMPSANDLDPSDSTTITREDLIETCAEMKANVLEHHGGCLAIKNIELAQDNNGNYNLKISFDRKIFDALRQITFYEHLFDDRQQEVMHKINCAEYQLWRLSQALRSNTIRDSNGKKITIGVIMLYADNNERIVPPET